MGGPDMAPQTPGECTRFRREAPASLSEPRTAYFSKIVRLRRSPESGLLASGASGAVARRTRARTRSRRRRAQTNSVARMARPTGMTISAGPGRMIIAPPTRSTVPPITAIAIRRARFSRGSRRPPKPQRCCPSMLDPPFLLFECAGDEPADQEPLEPDHDEHGRQARQHGRGGDVAPGHLVDAGEERERDRNRPARLRGRERVREEELVPAEQERQERGRGDPGREPGRHDPAERRERAGAVDGRSLLGLAGNLADEPDEERDRQPARQERRDAQQLGLGLERRQELPEERHRIRAERQQDQHVDKGLFRASHATTARARSSRRYAHATPITSAKTTTLTAEPKPSWSIWKRLR